jgi:hypothetical protein
LSRGSVERHTSHVQPIVGTPELVPEPSTVIFNAIADPRILHRLHKAEPEFRNGAIERVLLVGRQVAFGLFLQHGQQIDIVARQIEIRSLLLLAGPLIAKSSGKRQQAKIQFSL